MAGQEMLVSTVPQESIHVIMHRRLSELDSAIDGARTGLKAMEEERDLVAKIIRDYRLQKSGPTDPEGSGQSQGGSRPTPNSEGTPREPGTMTIKEMALVVIEEHPEGLGNTAIFDAIKQKFGVEVHQKSLSPQLGRLADKSKIVKENGVWKLAEKNAG